MFTVGLGLLGATDDHHDLPEHQLGHPHRLRLRRLAAGPVPARRRRHLHQGRRRRRRPRRQGRGRHPRGRPAQPGHHRRQRGRQRRRLRRHGRRPVRELRGHPRRLDHPRRRRVQLDRRQPGARPDLPARRPRHRRGRLDRRHLRREGQGGRDQRPQADQQWLPRRRRADAGRHAARRPALRRQRPRRNAGWKCFGAVAIGLVLAQGISRLTEYYTGTHHRPVQGDRRERRDRPGHRRSWPVPPAAWRARSTRSSPSPSPSASRWRWAAATCSSRFYLVALTGMGMLATTGVIVSRGHVRPGQRQRRRHRRDERRVPRRAGAHHGQPRRRRQHHQGRHQGLRHRLGRHRRRRPVRQLHRDRRRRALPQDVIDERSRRRVACSTCLPDQRRRSEGLHRPAHRRRRAVPVLVAGHPRRRSHRRRGRAGSPQAVRRRQDHEGREGARVRPGHRHLHRGVAARAGHAGPARRAHPGGHRLRHQLLRARRVPRRGHPRRPADGQLPVATPVARGTTPRSTSRTATTAARAASPQGRRHRRHRRRPVQGHRRPGAEPADQGDEPGLAADPAGDHLAAGQRRRPLRHRRRRAGRADRRGRLQQPPDQHSITGSARPARVTA